MMLCCVELYHFSTFDLFVLKGLVYNSIFTVSIILGILNQFLKGVCFCLYVHLGKKKTEKEGKPKGNKEVDKHEAHNICRIE